LLITVGVGVSAVLKKKRFLIGGLVVLAAIGFLIFQLAATSTPSLGVADLVKQKSSYIATANSQRTISLAGKVVMGSVQSDTQSRVLKFNINDIQTGQGTIPVVYKGTVPDTFKEGNDVLVTGYLDQNGVFQTNKLDPKCPSKYEPA
jgi:cytochrome c-type biogenesis protein CcmE